MIDTLIQDSLTIANKALAHHQHSVKSIDIWMWIAFVEFGILIFLLCKGGFKSKETARQKFKKESLKQDIDFSNIINSSFNSIQLYDELKVKCHPDKFSTDKEKYDIAESLFQEITKNKTNIKRLSELKIEATQKLNINF